MSGPTDWGGLALSIDLLNSAISQEVQVGDARVVILNRDSARQVRDAAEAWQRDYGKPVLRATIDGVLAWLDNAPVDWPWTGQDIAAMIREGCPDWHSPGGGKPHRDAQQVVEWLEGRSWGSDVADMNAKHFAQAIRTNFNLPAPAPVPLAGDGRTALELWASRGLFPGDMINEEGDLLGADGGLCDRGTAVIRKDQAARAAVFGWMLHEGYLPSASSPDHVVVERR